MLGGFSLIYNKNVLDDQTVRSQKLWLLLEYLIAFRDREISQNELVELLWPDDESVNPIGALKTIMHRLRSMLNNLEYMDGMDMIVQRRGTYAWNSKLDFIVDTDIFEELYKKGSMDSCSEEERVSCFRDAIMVYKGDFLPKTSAEVWAIPIQTYYHTLFLKIAYQMVELLKKRELNEEIVDLCKKAIALDPYDEFLYYNLIQALVDMGQQQQALAQYESMSELFFSKFGVPISDELTELYKNVVRTSNSREMNLGIIKTQLNEKDASAGAFYCEYEYFKHIYQLEARAIARTGQAIYLCLMTLNDRSGTLPKPKKLDAIMTKFAQCIQVSLRRGDVYAKYSSSQYIIMLPTANFENADRVAQRISDRFYRENPRSTIILSHTVQPIEPLMDEYAMPRLIAEKRSS